MGYSYGDYGNYYGVSTGMGIQVWLIVSIVLAIIGGIFVYILFLRKDNNVKGFLSWMHDFLNFKTLLLEDILKVTYLISALFVTLYSLGLLFTSGIVMFLVCLILGNLGLRLGYEMLIILIKICNNTSDINKKLGNKKKEK